LRAMLKKGYTVKIHKQETKIRIAFITRSTYGLRGGFFSGPFSQAYHGGFKSKIFRTSFDFSLTDPSDEARLACTQILKKHDLSLALRLSGEPKSGVNKINQAVELENEKTNRASIGLPFVGRYAKAHRKKNVTITKELNGIQHQVKQFIFDRRTKSRLCRKKKKGSSEPILMHNNTVRSEVASGFIDKQPNGIVQVGSTISYRYEFDQISIEDLLKEIDKLGKSFFLDEVSVTFPQNTPKGAAILGFDVILTQGAIYALRNVVRGGSDLLVQKAEAFLSKFFETNKTRLNPFYNQKKDKISRRWKRAYKNTLSDLKKVVGILSEFQPNKNVSGMSDDQFEKEQIKQLGEVAHLIEENHFLLLVFQSLGLDLLKYHYEIRGEFFNPYVINF
jgi:hypothetical protein